MLYLRSKTDLSDDPHQSVVVKDGALVTISGELHGHVHVLEDSHLTVSGTIYGSVLLISPASMRVTSTGVIRGGAFTDDCSFMVERGGRILNNYPSLEDARQEAETLREIKALEKEGAFSFPEVMR